MFFIDASMVGHLGARASAAIGLVESSTWLFGSITNAASLGFSVQVAHFIGANDFQQARQVFRHGLICTFVLSIIIAVSGILVSGHLPFWLGGGADIAHDASMYFLIFMLVMPFFQLSNLSGAMLKSSGDMRIPSVMSIMMCVLDVAFNYIFIYIFNMGVAGAAIATLASRVFCAVVVLWQLRMDRQPIVVRNYRQIRPDGKMIRRVLALGIPSGIENSMFQLGKLAIQSSVSTLGTVAIAAQAMTNILENLNGIAAIGVGIGLMTVVGQCLGAGRKDEAVYYIKKLSVLAEIIVVASCLLVFALTIPVTKLGGMEPESARMCFHMISWITVVKPIVWTLAFIPAYGLRAAGDVKFSMITSCITMWTFRFCLCVYLIRFRGFGPMAVWIGMFTDWTVRGIVFSLRFHSRKWLKHKVV